MTGVVGPSGGWRVALRRTMDLALVGVLTTLACLPLVTAGAALATASAAVHHWCGYDELPRTRDVARTFARALLPGLAASCGFPGLLALGTAVTVRGDVPARPPAVLVLGAVLVLSGLLLLVLAEVGATGGRRWRAAAARAVAAAREIPWLVPAAAVVAAVLLLVPRLVPQVSPLLPGYALFAGHVLRLRGLAWARTRSGH